MSFGRSYRIRGKKEAIQVTGDIYKKYSIGIYKQHYDLWQDEWHAIDLKTGLAFMQYDHKKDIIQNLKEGLKVLEAFRQMESYTEARNKFKAAIDEQIKNEHSRAFLEGGST